MQLSAPKLRTAAATPAPAAEAPAVPATDEAPIDLYSLRLSKPIRTHKGEVHTLEIREPTAADYIDVGRLPFDVRGEESDRRAQLDFKVAAAWASRLTDLDAILVGQLSSRDWLALVARINAILMNAGLDSVGNLDG